MVLTQAEELDVLHYYHLVVLHFIERAVDDLADVHPIPAGQNFMACSTRSGRARESFALGILAEFRPACPG
jgi:hypothetical protein